jgi:hypothetical protein
VDIGGHPRGPLPDYLLQGTQATWRRTGAEIYRAIILTQHNASRHEASPQSPLFSGSFNASHKNICVILLDMKDFFEDDAIVFALAAELRPNAQQGVGPCIWPHRSR